MKNISIHIPSIGKKLAKYSGKQVIDRIGEETIKEVVTNVLCGTNVRSLTEGLTRRRLALSNSALLMTYLNASASIKDFTSKLPSLVASEIKLKNLSPEEKVYLQWLIGLTGKSIQNVLRSDSDEITSYLKELESVLKETASKSKEIFGDLSGTLQIKKKDYLITWPIITQIFMAIGAQTLAIRGSEKSMYGKLFEKLILGSLLSILSFKYIKQDDTSQTKKVFWLSERGDKRESDATLLYKPGVGIKFDIGFIGPGNTEISLDKVSRFEREIEFGNQKHFMSTIILVDRIGDRSRIKELARKIDGNIVQMSMAYWVKEVVHILKESTGFSHPILRLSDSKGLKFIREAMSRIQLKDYI